MARFGGNGYIFYDLSTLNPPPSTTEDVIKLRFKTSNQNGVLLYADGNQGDFVALQLHRGNLLFSIDLGQYLPLSLCLSLFLSLSVSYSLSFSQSRFLYLSHSLFFSLYLTHSFSHSLSLSLCPSVYCMWRGFLFHHLLLFLESLYPMQQPYNGVGDKSGILCPIFLINISLECNVCSKL